MSFENPESQQVDTQESVLDNPSNVLESADFTREKYELGVESIRNYTSQTEGSLWGVEENSGLNSQDIGTVRQEVGLFEWVQNIKEKAKAIYTQLKENFLSIFEEDDPDIICDERGVPYLIMVPPEGVLDRECHHYDEKKLPDYFRYERIGNKRDVKEIVKERKNLLESRDMLAMSKKEYKTFFESNANLKQTNVGNCYEISAIHSMSCSPHFELLVRSSVKKLENGSWEVKIPFMSEDAETIVVDPVDLLPQKNKNFGGVGYDGKEDKRSALFPVEGKEGLKVLEAAYIKQQHGSVNRLAAEGGAGIKTLLKFGGNNFKEYEISTGYNSETNTLEDLQPLKTLSVKDNAFLNNILIHYNPEVHIATAYVKKNEMEHSHKTNKEETELIVDDHEYSVVNIDSEKNLIILANPFDTSKHFSLTFEIFREAFEELKVVEIDSSNFLENMKLKKENKIT